MIHFPVSFTPSCIHWHYWEWAAFENLLPSFQWSLTSCLWANKLLCSCSRGKNRSSDLHSLYISILMLINSYVCIERFVILLLLLKMNGIILGNETYVQFPNSNKLLNLGLQKAEATGSALHCTWTPALLLPEKGKKRKTNKQKTLTTWHQSLACKNLFPQTSSCTLANTACGNQPFFASEEHYWLRVPTGGQMSWGNKAVCLCLPPSARTLNLPDPIDKLPFIPCSTSAHCLLWILPHKAWRPQWEASRRPCCNESRKGASWLTWYKARAGGEQLTGACTSAFVMCRMQAASAESICELNASAGMAPPA